MRTPFLTVRTKNTEETLELGRLFAQNMRPGDVVTLCGEMGTGKTVFVQGVAEGLQCTQRATSPSFVLIKTYEGRLPVAHADLYRCDTTCEVQDLGLEAMFEPPWVALIEWGERAGSVIPPDSLEVAFEFADEEDVRIVQFRSVANWVGRMRELEDALRRPYS